LEIIALPFAKFGLERGGKDRSSQKAVVPSLEAAKHVFKSPFSRNSLENPPAKSKFDPLSAT